MWKGLPLTPLNEQTTKEERQSIVARLEAGETLPSLSSATGLDASSLARIYQRDTGRSITQMRHEQLIPAVEQVKAGVKVKDVAEAFEVASVTITAAFKKETGMTPAAWKRANRVAA